MSYLLRDSLKNDMARLASHDVCAEKFIHSDQLRFLMIEAYIWKLITTKVTGDNGQIWAGRLKDSFGSMQRVLHPSEDARFDDDG